MTAVEFYHEEMLEMERKWQMQDLNFGQWKEMAVEALRKAKELEKEQMLNAFQESRLTHPMIGFKHETFVDYYKQTYKSE